MTEAIFYAVHSGYHRNTSYTYSTARAGKGAFDEGGPGSMYIGMIQAGYYHIYEGGIDFNTSTLPDNAIIDSVALDVYNDGSVWNTPAPVTQVRPTDLGAGWGSEDFIAGDTLATLPLLASFDNSGLSGAGLRSFTVEAAMLDAINKTGYTGLYLCTDRQVNATYPYNWEIAGWAGAGTANPPTLTVNYHVPAGASPIEFAGSLAITTGLTADAEKLGLIDAAGSLAITTAMTATAELIEIVEFAGSLDISTALSATPEWFTYVDLAGALAIALELSAIARGGRLAGEFGRRRNVAAKHAPVRRSRKRLVIDEPGYWVEPVTVPGYWQGVDSVEAEVLVVAGGGGGVYFPGGGGGGGGGYLTGMVSLSGTMPATVGQGGPPCYPSTADVGWPGGDSSFGGLVAKGGGGGGENNVAGAPGGSGGGGGYSSGYVEAGGAGIAGQGHDGGKNCPIPSYYRYPSGGGGGAGGPGADGDAGPPSVSGIGGPGILNDIVKRGTYVEYARGGDGCDYYSASSTGGGGGYLPSGNQGREGIVVVRYRTAPGASITGGTKTIDGDDAVHVFTYNTYTGKPDDLVVSIAPPVWVEGYVIPAFWVPAVTHFEYPESPVSKRFEVDRRRQ